MHSKLRIVFLQYRFVALDVHRAKIGLQDLTGFFRIQKLEYFNVHFANDTLSLLMIRI